MDPTNYGEYVNFIELQNTKTNKGTITEDQMRQAFYSGSEFGNMVAAIRGEQQAELDKFYRLLATDSMQSISVDCVMGETPPTTKEEYLE